MAEKAGMSEIANMVEMAEKTKMDELSDIPFEKWSMP